MKKILFVVGILILFGVEITRVYFIMPFPGSQRINSIDYAYWIAQYINWIRVVAVIFLAWPIIDLLKKNSRWG
ncbi:hypothetical protein ABTJ74_19675, partial [Acinetobacter baumannii]